MMHVITMPPGTGTEFLLPEQASPWRLVGVSVTCTVAAPTTAYLAIGQWIASAVAPCFAVPAPCSFDNFGTVVLSWGIGLSGSCNPGPLIQGILEAPPAVSALTVSGPAAAHWQSAGLADAWMDPSIKACLVFSSAAVIASGRWTVETLNAPSVQR